MQLQAVPTERLFLVLQFVFQFAGLIQVAVRKPQQMEQFPVHEVLLEKHQRAHKDHGHNGQNQPVGAHFVRRPPPNCAHATMSGVENTASIANRAVHMFWWWPVAFSPDWSGKAFATNPTPANETMAATSGTS